MLRLGGPRSTKRKNGHVSCWLRFSNNGQDWDHAQRIHEAMIRIFRCVSPLYGLLKDHKPEDSWDPELGAPYRPVCGTCLDPNASLSDLLSGNIHYFSFSKIPVRSTNPRYIPAAQGNLSSIRVALVNPRFVLHL